MHACLLFIQDKTKHSMHFCLASLTVLFIRACHNYPPIRTRAHVLAWSCRLRAAFATETDLAEALCHWILYAGIGLCILDFHLYFYYTLFRGG